MYRVITGVLAMLCGMTVMAHSRVLKPEHDVLALAAAIRLFECSYSRLPSSLTELTEAPSGWGPLLDRVPSDPWGNPYHYAVVPPPIAPVGLSFYVWSHGRDGVPGGGRFDRDIGNWNARQLLRPWWRFWEREVKYDCPGAKVE
jgi:general secretion pathway protein G